MDIQGLKDKILQLAIQGKLVEQDKNDEPASVLLQRIKEERDKLVKEKKIRKQKPLPEVTDDEKPFEIPGSWEWVRLGEVVDILGNKKEKGLKLPYLDVKFLRGKNTNNFKDTGMLSEVGDILILVDGQNSGELFEVNEIGYIGSTLRKLYINKEIYMQYIVKNIEFNQKIYVDNKTGSAIPHLDRKLFNNTLIPLPPLAEQKRIVEKVDELFALIDELDSNKEDLLEVINLTRNQVLQEAIQGKLVEQNPEDEPASVLLDRIKEERDKLVKEKKIRKPKKLPPIEEEEKPFEIPKGWEWVRLGEVGNIINGNSINAKIKEKKYSNIENGYSYIATKDIDLKTSKINYENGVRIPFEDEEIFKIAPKNSILICSEGGSAGKKIGFTEKNVAFVNKLFNFNGYVNNINKYVYYLWKSPFFNERFEEIKTGIIGGVSMNNFKNISVPLPPLAEQKRIVKKVDAIMDMLDELESQLTN